MIPGVKITLGNGALGGLPASLDGVAGMVLTGYSTGLTGSFALGTPKVVYTLADAVALGITSGGANASAYRHIKEFYDEAGPTAELWIMLVADTVTLTNMADKTVLTGGKKLVDASQGRVRLLGLGRTPATGYVPNVTEGVDADSLNALVNGQSLAEDFASLQVPLRILIEGRSFLAANIGTLRDLHTSTTPRCGILLGGTAADGSSSIGLVLGRAASIPVSRNIGRVKDGALPILSAFIRDAAVATVAGVGSIHDKGYITLRTFPGRSGFFFSDDPMAAPTSDDYCMLARGRVIDKAHRITYDVYVNEVNDTTPMTAGKIDNGTIKYLQAEVQRRIKAELADEISDAQCFIDPAQDVLATSKLKIKLAITPLGYLKAIEVELGFSK